MAIAVGIINTGMRVPTQSRLLANSIKGAVDHVSGLEVCEIDSRLQQNGKEAAVTAAAVVPELSASFEQEGRS